MALTRSSVILWNVFALSLFLAVVFGKEQLCDDPEDDAEALVNGANDVVVVRQSDGQLKSTPLHVRSVIDVSLKEGLLSWKEKQMGCFFLHLL